MFLRTENDTVYFPYTLADANRDFPNISFPNDWEEAEASIGEHGIFRVTVLADPVIDPSTQKLVKGTPVFDGSIWSYQRAVVSKTPEEQQAYAEQVARAQDQASIKADSAVAALLKGRPTDIDSYIDANLVTLPDVKALLKALAKTVAVLSYDTIR